jgi:hypothetical protein
MVSPSGENMVKILTITEKELRNVFVLQGVNPAHLASPDLDVRLSAERTLAHNSGIEHVLRALLDLAQDHRVE